MLYNKTLQGDNMNEMQVIQERNRQIKRIQVMFNVEYAKACVLYYCIRNLPDNTILAGPQVR